MLKTDETNFWQNFSVQSDTINENVSISHDIQIHQNVNLNLINQVIAKYSAVWSETEWVVNISEKYWMQICFKNNWEIINAKLKHKFYSMSVNKHVIINETFNKLHNQEKTY